MRFVVDGVTFDAIVVPSTDGSLGGQRYEWRTEDGFCRCGRVTGKGTYWAAGGNVKLGAEYATLRGAMKAAIKFRDLKKPRAA